MPARLAVPYVHRPGRRPIWTKLELRSGACAALFTLETRRLATDDAFALTDNRSTEGARWIIVAPLGGAAFAGPLLNSDARAWTGSFLESNSIGPSKFPPGFSRSSSVSSRDQTSNYALHETRESDGNEVNYVEVKPGTQGAGTLRVPILAFTFHSAPLNRCLRQPMSMSPPRSNGNVGKSIVDSNFANLRPSNIKQPRRSSAPVSGENLSGTWPRHACIFAYLRIPFRPLQPRRIPSTFYPALEFEGEFVAYLISLYEKLKVYESRKYLDFIHNE
ncbi:hypothetical protein KM043_010246 [Ampulex compressa]|nr:hypothetical protein KM043_010246 [Ampulex compressa]